MNDLANTNLKFHILIRYLSLKAICEIPGKRNILYKGAKISFWPTLFEDKRKLKRENPRKRQHLLVVGLSYYKWYQSQIQSDVLARRLSLEGVGTRGGMPVRTLDLEGGGLEIPHRLKVTSTENTGLQRGMDCEISHQLEREQNILYKPLPSRGILKTLKENQKGKSKGGQYLLVGLDFYTVYTPFINSTYNLT